MLLEKDFPPDGRVENEIQALRKDGHSIDMSCITNKSSHIGEYLGGKVFRSHLSKINYKLSALALDLPFYFEFWRKNLYRILTEDKYDILHVHDLPLVEVALRLKKKFNIKVIADYHENRPEIMGYYPYLKVFPAKYIISLNKWHRYQEKVSSLVDRLILVTPEAKEYYANNYKVQSDNIHVVPNYANIDHLSAIPVHKDIVKSVSNQFSIVYFGDTGIRRGTLDLIKVASSLTDYSDMHFIIIGHSTEQNMLEKMVQELNLSNVELTGFMPFEIASSYLYGSKIGLCPFHRNTHHDTTYANKMFQYMYYGLPVIVSNCPSQQAIIEKEKCGIVFEAGNREALKKSILELYHDPAKRQKMGKAGNESVVKKYNWLNAGNEIKRLYSSLS